MSVSISAKISVGANNPLLLIAGPCQIESLEHSLKIANFVQSLIHKRGFKLNYVFKASFDKANRTRLQNKRGPGREEGLAVLRNVREKTGLPVITDVHSTEDIRAASSVVDILQIPAFLCRQTDILVEAGKSQKAVNIKKGQFLPPEDMKYVAEKISSTGNNNILLCERGSCFGYRDLVVDMRGLEIMKKTGYPVIFDATHSVQNMGGAQGASSGNREFIKPLIRAAAAVGIHGLFIECHDNPDAAPSDGPNMLPLSALESTLEMACAFHDSSLKYAD